MTVKDIKGLDIVIEQTLIDIYNSAIKSNLNEAQTEYYINSIIYKLSLDQRNDSYKKMTSEENNG